MLTLPAFNDLTFTVIDRDGAPWITATDLARALGYSREDKVAQIYQRNAVEFTDSMTALFRRSVSQPQIEVVDRGNVTNLSIRIFSLRGAHLVAMFARTPVAKEFRRWVLDVLEHWTAAPPDPPQLSPPMPAMLDMDPVRTNSAVALVREGRKLFGPRTAREIWIRMGLPVSRDEARGAHIDPQAEPLRAWLIGRISCTAEEAAEGIGIHKPGVGDRQRIGQQLRAWGWQPRKIRVGVQSLNGWFSPTGEPWHGIVAEDAGSEQP